MSFHWILYSIFVTVVTSEIFYSGGNYRLDDKYAIKTFTKHTSRLQCGQRCKYNDQCKSYSVNVALESCVLYNVHGDHDQRRSLISDALWEFYEKREVENAHPCSRYPCKMGECLSTPTMPWYRCQCHKDIVGQHCGQAIFGTTTYPAKSCLQIKQQNRNAVSAYYWIRFKRNKFQGFCDMRTDGGGWLMIAHIIGTAVKPFMDYVTNDVTDLGNMTTGEAVILGSAGMKLLKEEINANQLRIYCKKERTIHIVTKNNTKGYDVVDYFSDVTNTVRPEACGSFNILSDDNSVLSRNCQQWNYGSNKWSNAYRESSNTKLYDHTIYIASKNHIIDNKLCDDQTGDGSNPNIIGVWKYYIR